ncbi:MAG: hypothetical protein A2293_11375 [Elusimicrobia bacterium RIFOXYB2_FULL_49_7]|nr:MAG: hypothetical protein A2293_11375 [Elusimicrobia bacterium RIFOXYB2_FULL_49_7]
MGNFNADDFQKKLFLQLKGKTWENSNQLMEKMHDAAVSLEPSPEEMLLAWSKLGFIIAANIEREHQSIDAEHAVLKGALDWLAKHPTGPH